MRSSATESATESAAQSPPETAPLRLALIAQLGGSATVWLFVQALGQFSTVDFAQIPFLLALLQGGLAATIALKLRAPRWWLPIHLAFLPLVVAVQRLDIAPGWFLAAFLFLLLVFWRTDRSRVPLYLTNGTTAAALLEHLPAAPLALIDLGCGDGGLLKRLAQARPDCRCVGIEHAPLPWLLARLRTAGLPNVTIRRGDFWRLPWAEYDVVYAFLSPAPMPRLWRKACEEMRPGTLLVSNSFTVPDVAPETMVAVGDRRATQLYCYRPGPAR